MVILETVVSVGVVSREMKGAWGELLWNGLAPMVMGVTEGV
jgi:hypothetical protein